MTADAKVCLAKLAGLRAHIDQLLAGGVGWAWWDEQRVKEVVNRFKGARAELVEADPATFGDFPIRPLQHWSLAENKDILTVVRRDITYALETGARLGLCPPEPSVSSTPPGAAHDFRAAVRKFASDAGAKILVGVVIAVLAAYLIWRLGLK